MEILIADDSATVRAQLCDVLVDLDYNVHAVADGNEAWKSLSTGRHRLAILDWLMPGATGPEICRKLQSRQDLQGIYVIILTAKSDTADVATALSAGANDYVVKPFDRVELLARLDVARRIVRLQTDLIEATRLASIGELAAGIAHEVNTPLQYIGDNVQFLREGFESLQNVISKCTNLYETTNRGGAADEMIAPFQAAYEEADMQYLMEEIPNSVEQSLEGVHRATAIVQAMKSFCHPGSREKVAADLNQAIETTLTVARNEWKYVADVRTDLDAGLPHVVCVPNEFNQVILNLIVNAAHAIGDALTQRDEAKGTITLSTRETGPWAEIRIQDSGTGIPEEIRERVFDSFTTTKEPGKGTGQGLAIAHNVIVQQHGGTIHFETEMGVGTTFIIRLPLENESLSVRGD